MSQPGLFDLDQRYRSLSSYGDLLEVMAGRFPGRVFGPF